ncbi:MAG: hypothetical protein K0S95_731 [Pantoea eucrina]|jgi:type II secretory pathway component PulF|nr:hypothetical protein [Pantoea eucrina]
MFFDYSVTIIFLVLSTFVTFSGGILLIAPIAVLISVVVLYSKYRRKKLISAYIDLPMINKIDK